MSASRAHPLGSNDVLQLIPALAATDGGETDPERVDTLAALERLKAAASAAQARISVRFHASQLAHQEALRVPERECGMGIAGQVALARRESPHRGGRLLGLAHALVHELPRTLAALEAGEINEWRATLVARETACLTRLDRLAADAELADRLAGMGDREIAAEARRITYRLDAQAHMARGKRAIADRCVTIRPAPDTMTLLTGFLPVSQGVAAYAALKAHADSLKVSGDQRSRGQIMADTLVERVTGQANASDVPIEIQLVMTDQSLTGGDRSEEPAHLLGYGPMPAGIARTLVRDSAAAVWVRRLYAAAGSGRLIGMESTARVFPEGLRRLVVTRDQTCRTPWCDAPIRHVDHVTPFRAGGTTTAENGQGLCEACNYAKEASGWRTRAPDGAGWRVETTTPTGHTYVSAPPRLPGAPTRENAAASAA